MKDKKISLKDKKRIPPSKARKHTSHRSEIRPSLSPNISSNFHNKLPLLKVTVPEWLTGCPAKAMVFGLAGSNPVCDDFFFAFRFIIGFSRQYVFLFFDFSLIILYKWSFSFFFFL